MPFQEKLINYVSAAYPALWVQTHEELRLMTDIHGAMRRYSPCSRVYEWDIHRGLSYAEIRLPGGALSTTTATQPLPRGDIKDTDKIGLLLSWLEKNLRAMPSCSILVLKDFHPYLIDPVVVRRLRNLLSSAVTVPVVTVFASPVMKIPVELEKEVQTLDYLLPTSVEMQVNVDYIVASLVKSRAADGKPALPPLEEEARMLAAEAARGLTTAEANNAFSLAWIQNQNFGPAYVRSVFEEKVQQVKRGGLLTHLPSDVTFDQIGGLHGLKRWVKQRGQGYSEQARAYGLPYPKGMLLCGVQGCGKTLLAKATAAELGFPLFQLDIGALFGSLVGATEANFREMIRTVEALGRCVVLIEELEKSLNREAISGRGDTGTSSRSFGTLLSWLSERESPVFVVGTSNRFDNLPPELIRKGRFDELWWLDLPSLAEREDIFRVLLLKFKRDPTRFDLRTLAADSEDFTGAEIHEAIVSALFLSFGSGAKDMTTKGLRAQLRGSTPQGRLNQDDPSNPQRMSVLREKAKLCLRMASEETVTAAADDNMRAIRIEGN